MTGFVRYNMPAGRAGLALPRSAYDVAAFVLLHRRPHFRKNAFVQTRPLPAKYF